MKYKIQNEAVPEIPMEINGLIKKLKKNLEVEMYVCEHAIYESTLYAVDYAESFCCIPRGTYRNKQMSKFTEQAVILLATHLYKSRSQNKLFALSLIDLKTSNLWRSVHMLLRLDEENLFR